MRRRLSPFLQIPRQVVRGFLLLYQKAISPFLPRACRFYPTCSEYCKDAVALHGVIRGGWMGFRRLLRCQPFCRGGFDPVTPIQSPIQGSSPPNHTARSEPSDEEDLGKTGN